MVLSEQKDPLLRGQNNSHFAVTEKILALLSTPQCFSGFPSEDDYLSLHPSVFNTHPRMA